MRGRTTFMSLLILAALAAPAVMLNGCGKDDTTSAPNGSTITINPPGKKWSVALGACGGGQYNYEDFAITVRDANGDPLNDIAITVELDLAPNTADPVNQVMNLVDPDVNPAATVISPYSTRTGDYGTKNMRVQVDIGGCGYKGVLKVFSGTAFNSIEIEVAAS